MVSIFWGKKCNFAEKIWSLVKSQNHVLQYKCGQLRLVQKIYSVLHTVAYLVGRNTTNIFGTNIRNCSDYFHIFKDVVNVKNDVWAMRQNVWKLPTAPRRVVAAQNQCILYRKFFKYF